VGNPLGPQAASNTLTIPMREATNNLAETLMHLEPFVGYHEAERKLQSDHEALELLKDLSALQQTIRTEQYSGAVSDHNLNKLRELQSAVAAHATIRQYELAKAEAQAALRDVNQEISQLLGIDFASLTRRSGGCC
jgi:cell fate (sporulation/competence/biofilm development) regulator YlbF (YheA/YmcA/DUF963 family)